MVMFSWCDNKRHTANHQGHTHWDHVVHARSPTNANQTESGTGHSILHCHQKCPQATPWRCKWHESQPTGMGLVLDWSSRRANIESMPANKNSKQGVGFQPWHLYETLLSQNTVDNDQWAKQIQWSFFSFKKTAIHRISDTSSFFI